MTKKEIDKITQEYERRANDRSARRAIVAEIRKSEVSGPMADAFRKAANAVKQ